MVTWFLEFGGGPRFLENFCNPSTTYTHTDIRLRRCEDRILTRMCGPERKGRIIE